MKGCCVVLQPGKWLGLGTLVVQRHVCKTCNKGVRFPPWPRVLSTVYLARGLGSQLLLITADRPVRTWISLLRWG